MRRVSSARVPPSAVGVPASLRNPLEADVDEEETRPATVFSTATGRKKLERVRWDVYYRRYGRGRVREIQRVSAEGVGGAPADAYW